MRWFVALVASAHFSGAGSVHAQETLTIVLEGGDVDDGRGNPPTRADVGIRGDRIVAIGDLEGVASGRRLDVSGLAVVPGFIDIHSHAVRSVFAYPLAENYTRQRVTTVVGGSDGSSPYPIGEFLAKLDATPPATNFALTVGHGTIRRAVMGNVDRAPTADELGKMKAMVAQGMREGAFAGDPMAYDELGSAGLQAMVLAEDRLDAEYRTSGN